MLATSEEDKDRVRDRERERDRVWDLFLPEREATYVFIVTADVTFGDEARRLDLEAERDRLP